MREILFRGKRMDNLEWISGNLIVDLNGVCEIWDYANHHRDSYSCCEVIPETVGQFTGLRDISGVPIFEGDVVRILYSDWLSQAPDNNRNLEQYLIDISNIGQVIFLDLSWMICFKNNKQGIYYDSMNTGKHGRINVIGNVYDHQYLLKNK